MLKMQRLKSLAQKQLKKFHKNLVFRRFSSQIQDPLSPLDGRYKEKSNL